MTHPYVLHLTLAGLMGIHSQIITVSEVSAKVGGSISIPCLYQLDYRNHVKYLCKGRVWPFCSSAIKTSQNHNLGKYTISDDTNENIFTVTINNLTVKDYRYWCAVEIEHWNDIRQRFQLSVTTDMPSLYVDQQEFVAFEGGSVTVTCHYKYQKVRKWCRLGSTCVTNQTGSIDGTTVIIDSSVRNVFCVTMSDLRTGSSGWYWCSNGDSQVPVHLTVHELASTTTMFPSTTKTLLTSTEPHTAQPTTSTIYSTGGVSPQDNPAKVTVLIAVLVMLLLLVPAVVFGWWMKKCSKTKPKESDITAGSQTERDSDVLYSTIVHNLHIAAHKKDRKPEENVTYSTLVMNGCLQQKTEPEA